MPGAGKARELGAIPRRGQIPRRLGIDMEVRNFVDGKWNFERANRRGLPRVGPVGAGRRKRRLTTCASPGRKRIPHDARSISRVSANSDVMCAPGRRRMGERSSATGACALGRGGEFVSREAAAGFVWVVLKEDLSVDEAATRDLRQKTKIANSGSGVQH